MASILITRNQFNITPQGITHKPTDAYITRHAGDPYSGSIRLGHLADVNPTGDRYDKDEVRKMMMELWTEFVDANSDLFK